MSVAGVDVRGVFSGIGDSPLKEWKGQVLNLIITLKGIRPPVDDSQIKCANRIGHPFGKSPSVLALACQTYRHP